MSLNSRKSLVARLRRGKAARQKFVESNLTKAVAHQIRATRDKLGWSQERLASEVGMNQNAISRLESSDYGKPTITTLKRIAASMDVGLVVRFVPFSEMIDWVSGTPRTIEGLTTAALAVSNFDREEEEGLFESSPVAASFNVVQSGSGSIAENEPLVAEMKYTIMKFDAYGSANPVSNKTPDPHLIVFDEVMPEELSTDSSTRTDVWALPAAPALPEILIQ